MGDFALDEDLECSKVPEATHGGDVVFTANDSFVGGAIAYKNDHGNASKDEVIKSLMPDYITECALYLEKGPNEPCSSAAMIAAVSNEVGVSGDPAAVIDAAKIKLNCDTERCVVSKLSGQISKDEIARTFKIKGPVDSTLLSNYNIDGVLNQWRLKYVDFFPYNFNMLNYASYSFSHGQVLAAPDTLATIPFIDLYKGNYPREDGTGVHYRTAACVINTDVYQGRGKHWMALFADTRGPVWSIEFFNSSGNSPAPEWCNWMVKTKSQMETLAEADTKTGLVTSVVVGAIRPEIRPAVKIDVVKVCNIRHQQSRSECGLYALFYIWARLHGVSYEYFKSTPIKDQLMFEFRQHLYSDPKHKAVKVFDFNEHAREIKIEWE